MPLGRKQFEPSGSPRGSSLGIVSVVAFVTNVLKPSAKELDLPARRANELTGATGLSDPHPLQGGG